MVHYNANDGGIGAFPAHTPSTGDKARKCLLSLILFSSFRAGPKASLPAAWRLFDGELINGSLSRRTDSWILAPKAPEKKYATLFYSGRLKNYCEMLKELVQDKHSGFSIT